MKVHETHSEPSWVATREPYRLRIEGRNGEVIEITEHTTGGFRISSSATFSGSRLVVWPDGRDAIMLEVK